MPSVYILNTLVYVKQNINSFAPQNAHHDHLTRFRHNLVTPYVRLAKTRHCHVYHQLALYNKLPIAIRNLPLNRFKKTVTLFLKDQSYYSVADYMDDRLTS